MEVADLNMKDAKKQLIYELIVWIAVDAVCITANFNYFVFGNSYGNRWINLLLSALYFVFMIVFAYRTKTRFIGILGGVCAALGIIGYAVSRYRLIADWIIIPSVILFAPLVGIKHLLKTDALCWLFFAGFVLLLMIIAYIRKHTRG